MTRRIYISPSLMCMDLLDFKNQIDFLSDKADSFHIDIMDGHYVPNLTLSPFFMEAVKRASNLAMDVHLMVMRPQDYIEPMAKAGAKLISMHAEVINGQAFRLLDEIKRFNCATGITINPETPIDIMLPYIKKVDKITVMTVDPGFAGQPFIEETIPKIMQLKKYKEENGLNYNIEIDGSCNDNTFKRLIEAGAETLIVGSSGLFGIADTLPNAWQKMKQQILTAGGEIK